MGLFGGGNKQSQSTDVQDLSAGANVGGDAAAAVTSTTVAIGSSGSKSPINNGTFNFTDAGAVNRSFDFADSNQEKTFGFLKEALGSAVGALNTSRDSIRDASTQSINAIAKAAETPEEKEGNRNLYVLAGVLILVGTIFYFQSKGKA
ncbi:hypothetical protein C3942_15455 [Solimonas fluminis]|uniref:Uncharacterized protein n=1 Tax=Solimonas fluminis TaxID=2086571 RepID=A0A2S5TDZ5_9GAMM|nr:hypothetical protein [Solimonas fluminis]PPE71809.1 hypothetical protein C3942_21680 [Solimonas fluminis]PPE73211.1 hypothetical protein C3942_15455 [Solimonas fluminis]